MEQNYIEFHELENLAHRSKKSFLKEIENRFDILPLDKCISLLKMTGICVDIYENGTHNGILNECINYLISKVGYEHRDILTLKEEIKAMDRIFASFGVLRDKSGVNSIRPKKQVSAFLIATEIFIGAGWEYSCGKKIEDVKKRYPFVLSFVDNDNILVDGFLFSSRIGQLMDNIMEYTGVALNYFIFNKLPFVGINTTISADDMKAARQHFNFIDQYDRLDAIHNWWKFYKCSVSPKDDIIKFDPTDKRAYLSQKISSSRFRQQKMKWMFQYKYMANGIKIDSKTKKLPPDELRHELEALAGIFCYEFFGSEDLNERVNQVPLSEWVRAITVLIQEGTEALEKRSKVEPLELSRWCIVKSQQEWINTFHEAGIGQENARIIFKALVFKPRSKDLIDCPLIQIDDKFVALPSVISKIEPASSLLSNFISKGYDVSFKGNGLEKRFRKSVKDAGLPCENLSAESNGEQYECDAAFTIGKDLFFVECKSFLQPTSPREYYELEGKLGEATVQLNRIADFYSLNIKVVREQLKLEENWNPERIIRIILCTTMLGEPIKLNGCYVIDESAADRFFDREPPAYAINNIRIFFSDDNYEGEITTGKFLSIITKPPQITMQEKQYQGINRRIVLDNTTLEYFYYNKTTGDYEYLTKDKMKKLAEVFNIPENELKKMLNQ